MHALKTLVIHPKSTSCECATEQKSFPLFSTKPMGLRHIASNAVPRSGALRKFPIRAHLRPVRRLTVQQEMEALAVREIRTSEATTLTPRVQAGTC